MYSHVKQKKRKTKHSKPLRIKLQFCQKACMYSVWLTSVSSYAEIENLLTLSQTFYITQVVRIKLYMKKIKKKKYYTLHSS